MTYRYMRVSAIASGQRRSLMDKATLGKYTTNPISVAAKSRFNRIRSCQ